MSLYKKIRLSLNFYTNFFLKKNWTGLQRVKIYLSLLMIISQSVSKDQYFNTIIILMLTVLINMTKQLIASERRRYYLGRILSVIIMSFNVAFNSTDKQLPVMNYSFAGAELAKIQKQLYAIQNLLHCKCIGQVAVSQEPTTCPHTNSCQ